MSTKIPPEYFLQVNPDTVERIAKIYGRRRTTWLIPVDDYKSPHRNGSGWDKEPISKEDVSNRLNDWAVAVGITPLRVNLFAFDVDPPVEHKGTPEGTAICERRLDNLIEHLGIEPVVCYYSPRGIHAYFRVGDKPPGWLSECKGGDFYVNGEKYGEIRYGVGGQIVIYDFDEFTDGLDNIEEFEVVDYEKVRGVIGSLNEPRRRQGTVGSLTNMGLPQNLWVEAKE